MATTRTHSPFTTVPEDVLQRLLAGVPLDDHRAAASVCRAFGNVIDGPNFLVLRRRYGFAERGFVLVETCSSQDGPDQRPEIRTAHKKSGVIIITDISNISRENSTTDGGSRLFVSTMARDAPNQILAVDASSRRWKRITSLPQIQQYHCMEWHGRLLYVAGGVHVAGGVQNIDEDNPGSALNSLHAFDETTGLWEELPPMPYACALATSGVIGNQLFIAGGYSSPGNMLPTLQIYDIATRTWRLGHRPPGINLPPPWLGVVVDGKLLILSEIGFMAVYDPQFDTWTREKVKWCGLNQRGRRANACVHNGRPVVFSTGGDGMVFERADGAWSQWSSRARCGVDTSGLQDFVSESVILS